MHWLAHFLGLDNLSGPFYGFWSGAGSDITELALIGGLIAAYRKHNCHIKGCWRIGKRNVDGTSLIVCHKHHPENPPSLSDLGA
ncbi:MAG: hypothetical protein KGL35_14290 [Bradyrhizobium sp.]|nr:hypothetical protein [Bradyrhizobium sp.]